MRVIFPYFIMTCKSEVLGAMLALCIKTINAFPDDFYCASGFYEKSKAGTAFYKIIMLCRQCSSDCTLGKKPFSAQCCRIFDLLTWSYDSYPWRYVLSASCTIEVINRWFV